VVLMGVLFLALIKRFQLAGTGASKSQ